MPSQLIKQTETKLICCTEIKMHFIDEIVDIFDLFMFKLIRKTINYGKRK